ncbi:TPA: potassium:proton antiporter [Neisseria meningitidis]
MDWMGSLFLLGGALLFLSVVSTTLPARLGMPLLLVSPAGVLDGAAEALAIAAFLMLVARPPAVFGGLWKFNYSLREKAYSRIEMQSDTVLQAGIWRGTSCPTARSI